MTGEIHSEVKGTLVKGVSSRPVKNGTATIWEVETQDGTKWTTFRSDMGNAAQQLINQVCDLKVKISQNGNFTNYNLEHIALAAGQSPVAQAAVQAQQAQQTFAAPVVDYNQYKSGEEEKERRKNTSIHRQTATKVAAQLMGEHQNEDDFWATVEALVGFYATGVAPRAGQPTPEPSGVTSHTDAPPPYGDADIPF